MFQKLKGKDKFETIENYCISFIFVGVIILSLGIGLTVVSTSGIPAILAMLGSLISFLSIVVLVFNWLAKELAEK